MNEKAPIGGLYWRFIGTGISRKIRDLFGARGTPQISVRLGANAARFSATHKRRTGKWVKKFDWLVKILDTVIAQASQMGPGYEDGLMAGMIDFLKGWFSDEAYRATDGEF